MLLKTDLFDLEKLVELEALCFRNPWTYKELFAEMKDNPFSSIYFYTENDQVLGYIIVWKIFEQASISRIAIVPEARRQGHGLKMLQEVLEMLSSEEMESISLEVRVGNESALALYNKLGFTTLSRIKGYYEDGEDAFRMFRMLDVL